MKESHYKTLVGLFGLASIVVLGILLLLFGGDQSLFSTTYNLNVLFAGGITGVQAGQSVTVNGVRVGQTRKVEFWDAGHVESGVRVIIGVDSGFDIPEGATVSVASSIMGFGKPAIMINVAGLSEARPLPRDGSAVIHGAMVKLVDQVLPPDMQETLVGSFAGIKSLADSLKPVASSLDAMLQQRDIQSVDAEQAIANISTLVQRFDRVLKNLNGIVGEPKNAENLSATLANARVMSERGIQMMEKLDRLGEAGIAVTGDATGLIRDLRGSVDTLSSVLTELNKTAAAMNDTKGSVGLMLNDNRLYEELILTTRRMSAVLEEMRAAIEIFNRDGIKVKL
ncbi:MAG: hypothetical protein KF841_08100 [Phycisphaerae bacterium]|nr:hypothetical protein [Phycisphaerae bacterium]